MKKQMWKRTCEDRRRFIGGSDARIITGNDEAALLRYGGKSVARSQPEDLSGNLIVQLGLATEDLNRRWYEANTGQTITDIQRHIRHPATPLWWPLWMAGSQGSDAVFGAKFDAALVVLGRGGRREIHAAAAAQYVGYRGQTAVLLVITWGAAKGPEIVAHADPLYQHLIVTAERKFWRCVETGEPPQLFGVRAPKPLFGHRGDPHRRHDLVERVG